MDQLQASQLSGEMLECMNTALDCQRACMETVNYCLQKGGAHAEAGHVRRLLDCARSCELTAELVARNSELYVRMCEVCADFCEFCAESCGKFPNDQQMSECADLCKECADVCLRMAA